MKTAGDILSSLFDAHFAEKAQGYSKLFDSWTDITEKNGIASAAAHSHIKDIDKGILYIEMDHPGWKQILQTKQSKLLNDFRIRFPGFNISGISLILGSAQKSNEEHTDEPAQIIVKQLSVKETPLNTQSDKKIKIKKSSNETSDGLDAIKDEALKEKLRKLGQAIAERENS